MLLKVWIVAIIDSKFHLSTVLNNWITLGYQMKLSSLRIVYSNLMRAKIKFAIYGLIYKTGTTHTSHENLSFSNILDIKGFYLKWKVDNTRSKVFNYYTFFSFIFYLCLSNFLSVQIFYCQIISNY